MFGEMNKKTVDLLSIKTNNYLSFLDSSTIKSQKTNFPETSFNNLAQDVKRYMKVSTAAYEQELFSNKLEEDQRVLALKGCMQRWQILEEQQNICTNSIKELCETYNSVSEKTSSLHNACDQMMSQQTQLAAANEQIKSKLYYYQQYDWLMKVTFLFNQNLLRNYKRQNYL